MSTYDSSSSGHGNFGDYKGEEDWVTNTDCLTHYPVEISTFGDGEEDESPGEDKIDAVVEK